MHYNLNLETAIPYKHNSIPWYPNSIHGTIHDIQFSPIKKNSKQLIDKGTMWD